MAGSSGSLDLAMTSLANEWNSKRPAATRSKIAFARALFEGHTDSEWSASKIDVTSRIASHADATRAKEQ
jgi:hypothetical protein